MDATPPDVSQLTRTPVDLSGLLRVLAKNLYSTPEVAIRELVQNAHDGHTRRRIEDTAAFDERISVIADPVHKTLVIEDTGAGLTRAEIDECLATVGAGYTRRLRERVADPALIGQFGIGFLSAYVVASRVDVLTTSYSTPEASWQFTSQSGERYLVSAIPTRPVGTRVILTLAERFHMLADPAVVAPLLRHYCRLLPTPISLVRPDGSAERINEPPPWRVAEPRSLLARQRDNLAFAASLERQFEPICAMEIETAKDAGHARGVLWVQDGGSYATSDNRRVLVYVRGMLVSDDARELLPSWAGFVGAALEAESLEPTASREDVQRDDAFRALAEALKHRLIEGLLEVAQNQATWRRVILRHNEALLGAALADDRLYQVLRDVLRVPTSEGELPIGKVVERSRGEVFISLGQGGAEEILVRALGVPVVDGTRYAVLPFVRRVLRERGVRSVELGTAQGLSELFPPAPIDARRRDILAALFHREGVDLEFTTFSPATLPLVLATDREAELRERIEQDQADKRMGAAILSLARQFTQTLAKRAPQRMFVNVSAPLIERLSRLHELDPPRAAALASTMRALCTLMSRRDDGAADDSVSDALEAISSGLLRLSEPGDES
jgi:molecular chaperone HtpG